MIKSNPCAVNLNLPKTTLTITRKKLKACVGFISGFSFINMAALLSLSRFSSIFLQHEDPAEKHHSLSDIYTALRVFHPLFSVFFSLSCLCAGTLTTAW